MGSTCRTPWLGTSDILSDQHTEDCEEAISKCTRTLPPTRFRR